MMINPIVEKKENEIQIIYTYNITHITQKKKRKTKNGTIKENIIHTNSTTFPFDIYKLLKIEPDENEKEHVYFYTDFQKIYVSKTEPEHYDEIKKSRLNHRKGLKNDYVDPKTSRRSKLVFLPKKIFGENINTANKIEYIIHTKTEKITCRIY